MIETFLYNKKSTAVNLLKSNKYAYVYYAFKSKCGQ